MDEEPKKPRAYAIKAHTQKSFKEKYKELQPEKYAKDVEKVMEKGLPPPACTALFA